MNQSPVRQLSAIMFADIVGYTAMMQQSEAHAVASRDRFRGVLTGLVPKHHGTVVQHYGDGTLAIFPSAVEATTCALKIQRSMTTEPRVPLRIGLHVGDIVRDHEGVYGDGVNLAARVQALAVGGSVLVTERVAEEVKNHAELPLVRLGQYRVKNVSHVVGVFAVADDAIVVPTAQDIEADAPAERSVAVLPFVNMSGDPAREFFSDGVSDEIINALAQLPGLKVTSRTSSFAFKGTNADIREIASTLDVGHVLEGSVRASGNRVRVTAQLIEADSGFQVFSENWDRELEDVFVIQDELSRAIAGHLQSALAGVPAATPSLTPRPTPDPEAYTLYLEGRHYWNMWSPEGALRSIELYRQAIRMDPGLAPAQAALASSYVFLGAVGRLPAEVAYGEAQAAARVALSLEPDSSEAEVALALTALLYEWNRDRADRHFDRALALGPGSATVHHYRGISYSVLRRHSLAVAALHEARDLDPLSPAIGNELARTLLVAGQPEEALVQVERTLELAPSFRSALESKAMIHWALEDVAGAIDAIRAYRSNSPSPFAGAALLGYLLARSGDADSALEQHRLLEERERVEPETSLHVDFAVSHLGMRQYELALNRLEKAVDSRSAAVIFARSMPVWEEVSDHARFKALEERIGLWR
jgi:TolB-like protein/tetratricopeptide (TPR) repeat protein